MNKQIKIGALVLFYSLQLFSGVAVAQSEVLAKFRQYREKFQSAKKDDQKKKLSEIDSEVGKTQDAGEKKLLLMAKALLATEQGHADIAEQVFKDLTSEKHNLLEYAHYYYGAMLVQEKRLSEAKNQYQKVLDLSPNAQLQMDSQFQLAKINIDEKKFKEARTLLVKLEKRQRRTEYYPETIYTLAQAERGAGNQGAFCKWAKTLYTGYPQFQKIEKWGPQLSQDEFEGKPTGCPVTTDDRKSRIRNFQWAGLGEKAFGEIKALRTQASPAEKYEVDRLEVGYWLHEGEMKKALELLQPYYEAKKSDINYLNLLASTAARAGEYQAAVGSYYRVYELNKRGKYGKQALYQAAFLSYQFQDYDGAARKFTEFNKVYSGSGLSRDARWHLAWIKYLKADYSGAYASLGTLLKEAKAKRRGWKSFPKDRVTYWMAMSQYRQGNYAQAKTLLETLAKDPLVSYYSIAAGFRIQKIDSLMPKPALRLSLNPQKRQIARFSFVESVIPPEDFGATAEENETEESLVGAQGSVLAEEAVEMENPENEAVLSAEGQPLVNEKAEEAGTEIAKPSFANPVLVQKFERARDLMILGLQDWARWDLYEIEKKTSNRDYLKTLMQEYQTIENYNRSAYIAQVNFGGQRALHGVDGVRYLWEFAYPKAFSETVQKYSKQYSVPQELIWGIMRAESNYKKSVISPVGALGLMQVMPGTGQKIAEILGEKSFQVPNLLEPEDAVKIGGKYLQRLGKKFDQSVPLIAAAYNAGPHRVKSWLSTFGNRDMDEFIEHIPFLETRNYVKKVVSNYQIYSILYSQKKDALSYLADAMKVKIPTTVSTKETWEDI